MRPSTLPAGCTPAIWRRSTRRVTDAKYGEELRACIILRPGVESSAEEIREFCRGRIAHHKVPRYVTFVDAFPMTITGKIRKSVLREQMAEAFSRDGRDGK